MNIHTPHEAVIPQPLCTYSYYSLSQATSFTSHCSIQAEEDFFPTRFDLSLRFFFFFFLCTHESQNQDEHPSVIFLIHHSESSLSSSA
jgi:hypothetical protein